MSSYFYPATSLTGGISGSLDSIDGNLLNDGDVAIVVVLGDSCYFYILDADSGLGENSPAIISPDLNAGTKRWIQVGVSGAVAFATWQEVASGVVTNKAVAPAQLEDSGVLSPPLATAGEIVTGTVNKIVTAAQLKEAGIVPLIYATASEITSGTVQKKIIAPDQLADAAASTGTGKVVRANSPTLSSPTINSATINSPTLTTPALGTPASGDLRNCTISTASLSAIYPVGCIYTTTVATNPATVFGFGTWESFGAGRVLVGLDATQTEFDTVEETGGEKTHTLTANEIPAHTHSFSSDFPTFGQSGYPLGANGSFPFGAATCYTSSVGGGAAHNNLQPYIVVYFWKRTA